MNSNHAKATNQLKTVRTQYQVKKKLKKANFSRVRYKLRRGEPFRHYVFFLNELISVKLRV